jgi:hypothetical protein
LIRLPKLPNKPGIFVAKRNDVRWRWVRKFTRLVADDRTHDCAADCAHCRAHFSPDRVSNHSTSGSTSRRPNRSSSRMINAWITIGL